MWKKILIFLFLAYMVEKNAGLTCLRCRNERTHEECDQRGIVETCTGERVACFTIIRVISYEGNLLISKGCKQRPACVNNVYLQYCKTLPPNTRCFCCCDGDDCNRGNSSCFPNQSGNFGIFQDGMLEDLAEIVELTPPPSIAVLDFTQDKQQIMCNPHLITPTNGRLTCSNNNYVRSICTFTCIDSFALEGTPNLACQENGKWSALPPKCRFITCPSRNSILNNGRARCTNENNVRSICRFSCNHGYIRMGSSASICALDNNDLGHAKWSKSQPRCIKRCPPPRIIKGRVRCNDQNIVGSQCTFRCTRHYGLVGSATTTCMENRFRRAVWSEPFPVCERLQCPDLGPITNGNWSCTDNMHIASRCTYSCDDKHQPTPYWPQRTLCRADQTWTETAPCCSKPCPANPYMDIAFALDSSSSLGEESWDIMIDFVKTIIGSYKLDENATCAALYRYNRKVDTDNIISFNYGKKHGKAALMEKISSLPYNGFGTHTGSALEFALNTIFNETNGHREDAREVLIVLTDGKSTDEVARHAENLRNHGVLTYAIAVRGWRGRLDLGQLNSIAGMKPHLFILEGGFSGLTTEFAMQIAYSVCHDPCINQEILP